MPSQYLLSELVAQLGGELVGEDVTIQRVGTLGNAKAGQIAFLANDKYRHQLATTQASAVIVSPHDAKDSPVPVIVTDNPYLYFARVAQLIYPASTVKPGIHPSAVIAETAEIEPDVQIDAHAMIGEHVHIGRGSVIGAGSVIGEHSSLGENCRLHANVTIYKNVQIGDRAILHSGCVLGADGFGFAENKGEWVKIPQIGGVILGNDVEIGANTTIDAGAIDPTIIEDGVKIDNLVMIGHNGHVGAHTVIAACTGISGSVTIGKHCMFGGAVGVAGHLSISDYTVLLAAANVSKSITKPGIYSSSFPVMPHREWLKNLAQFRQLDELAHIVRTLDKQNREEDNS